MAIATCFCGCFRVHLDHVASQAQRDALVLMKLTEIPAALELLDHLEIQ